MHLSLGAHCDLAWVANASSSGMAAAPTELIEELSVSMGGAEALSLPFPAFHLDRHYFGGWNGVNQCDFLKIQTQYLNVQYNLI